MLFLVFTYILVRLSFSVTCGRSVVFFVSKAHHHHITELLLKVALNTITNPNPYIPVDHYVVSYLYTHFSICNYDHRNFYELILYG